MRDEPNTVTHGPTKCRVRNPRRKSRITRKRVMNSAKRERGPSRKISSARAEGAVRVELAAASGSMTESSLFCTKAWLTPTAERREAKHENLRVAGVRWV